MNPARTGIALAARARRWRKVFVNRVDAGRALGARLQHLRGEDVVVLGLPRGGVPVAAQVARALEAPLDMIMVRKLGVPFQSELAMGAIGEDGARVLIPAIIRRAAVSADAVADVERRERAELKRRAQRFRADADRIPLAGRTAVIVDDGIATGSTTQAACEVARAQGARRIVLAVPVAPAECLPRLQRSVDELVCLSTPQPFFAIGEWYDDFSQTSDEEVIACLQRARAEAPPSARTRQVPDRNQTTRDQTTRDQTTGNREIRDREVTVRSGTTRLAGHLTVPASATGLVVFAHGSGSSRHSPRNRFVAAVLNRSGLGTLLLDLLTDTEELDRATVFDIELLAHRLMDATAWLHAQPELGSLRIGYFGASTGAAAALWAAAELQNGTEPAGRIAAVVSRGGRPDLAASRLAAVSAPTLLIVGGHDEVVHALNRRAQEQLRCPHRLVVIPGATHLFEEPGALDTVADLAREWFLRHCGADPAESDPAESDYLGQARSADPN